MKETQEIISITPPKFRVIGLKLIGTSPYMQNNFSQKAIYIIREKQEAGQAASGKKVRSARDFEADFMGAQHISQGGWCGIPASSFRNASIDVCRMVGYKMTHMKMSLFVEQDGIDKINATPLVKIHPSLPEKSEMMVRNATGVADIRVRPLWREWSVNLRVRFDEDQFKATDVINLISRAGLQVGIGEGRPFSKQSNGMGFGMWRVEAEAETAKKSKLKAA